MKTAIVTGHSGALGAALATKLIGQGIKVIGLSRSLGQVPGLHREIQCDLEKVDWHSAIENVDRVFHCAAVVHQGRDTPRAVYQSINVQSTRRLADVCAQKSCTLIFASSIAALIAEESGPEVAAPYGQSKRQSELDLAQRSNLRWVALRFPLLYGPGGRGNVEKLLWAILRRRFWPLACQNKKSLLFFEDAAQAMIAASATPACHGKVIPVGPPACLTVSAFMQACYQACERTLPPAIPYSWARRLGYGADALFEVLGRARVARASVETLCADTGFATGQELENLTGFRAPTPLLQGLQKTVQWLQREKEQSQ